MERIIDGSFQSLSGFITTAGSLGAGSSGR